MVDLLSSLPDESLIGFGLGGYYHIDDNRVYQIKVSQKFFQKLAAKRLVDNSFCFAYSLSCGWEQYWPFSIRMDKFLFPNIFSKIRQSGSTIEASQILIIAIEISSQLCAFLESNDQINFKTFALSVSTFSRRALHLG